MIKGLYNFLVYLGVLWAANHFFGEYVQIDSTKTLILTVVIMFVASYTYYLALLVSMLLMLVGVGCVTTPILIVVGLVFTPLSLYLSSMYIPGFHIEGFWTYACITVILWIVTAKSTSNTNSGDNKSA